jgi:hypothetical protein
MKAAHAFLEGGSARWLKVKNPDAPAVRRAGRGSLEWLIGRRGRKGEDGSIPLHRQLLPQSVCRRVVQVRTDSRLGLS